MYQEEYRNNLRIQKYNYQSLEYIHPLYRKIIFQDNLYLTSDVHIQNFLWGLCETISQFYESAVIVDEKERFLLSDQYISTVALSYKNKFQHFFYS